MSNPSTRIGVLHFSHETVTFLKNDTTLEDFIYPGSPAKGEAMLNFDPKSFIAATFDLHGNEDEEFLKYADMAFTVKYFPHYDGYLQGERAARTLVRAIRGDYKPAHVTTKIPIISPTVLQWTGASPWMDLIQRSLVWEAREPAVYVNVFFGFPFADVPDVGMTIQVLTNGNAELAARVGRDISDAIWRVRDALLKSTRIHSIA